MEAIRAFSVSADSGPRLGVAVHAGWSRRAGDNPGIAAVYSPGCMRRSTWEAKKLRIHKLKLKRVVCRYTESLG